MGRRRNKVFRNVGCAKQGCVQMINTNCEAAKCAFMAMKMNVNATAF